MLEETTAAVQSKPKKPRKKNDILLKGAVEDFFPYVLRFFYRNADEIFDMNKGFEWMNTELHEILPALSQKGGSRAADVLVKVHLRSGGTELFLLHLELQKATNKDFPGRVFQYWYRLTDRYKSAVVSLAVFTGLKSQLQPNQYNFNMLGTELNFKYNTYQIFNHTEEELIEMDNPFALVVLAAQQEAIYDDKVQDGLLSTRIKIVRSLASSKNFDYKKIGDFLYFMDQLIPLKVEELRCIFDQELTTLFGGNITMGIMEAVRAQILDEGIEKGIEQGEAKGEHKKAIEMAWKLLAKGMDVKEISELTGLGIQEIEAL